MTIIGLRPGAYRVTVVHRAFAPSVLTVEAGSAAESQVVLHPGGQVNVSVVNRRGGPVEGASIELAGEGDDGLLEGLLFLSMANDGTIQTGADGGFVLGPVPPGLHRIAATKGGARSREERVQVEEGEAAGVRLTIP